MGVGCGVAAGVPADEATFLLDAMPFAGAAAAVPDAGVGAVAAGAGAVTVPAGAARGAGVSKALPTTPPRMIIGACIGPCLAAGCSGSAATFS